MAINFTDSGSTIKLDITTTYSYLGQILPAQVIYLPKNETEIKQQGNNVLISDKSSNYKFLYSDITTPTGGSAAVVTAAIEAMQDSSDVNNYLVSIVNLLTGVAPVNIVSVLETNALVLNETPGTLISLTGYSKDIGAQYLQLHNLIDLVNLNVNIPQVSIPLDDLGALEAVAFSLEYTQPMVFSAGIVVAISKTGDFFTESGTKNWFSAQIKNG